MRKGCVIKNVFVVRLCISILVGWCLSVPMKAQFDGLFTNQWVAPNYVNPAYAGATDYLNLTFQHKQQWVGISNAPKTFFMSLEMPYAFLGRTHGLGLQASTESIGWFDNTNLGLQYAFKYSLWGGTLSAGLQMGIINMKVDGSKASIPTSPDHTDPGADPNIPKGEVGGMGFDASLGAMYFGKDYYLGLSMTHLTQPTIEMDDKFSQQVPMAGYFIAAYDYRTKNKQFVLSPSFILRTDFIYYQPSLLFKALYLDRFFGLVNYRLGESIGLGVGVEIENFRVGYTCDILTSALSKGASTSHEVFVSYRMKMNFNKEKSDSKRKSSRYL